MIIEVDCNNDCLLIKDGNETFNYPVKEPNKFLKILEEIFNRMDDPTGTELVKIDEDRRTTVAEW